MSVPAESWAMGGGLWEQWPPQEQPLGSGKSENKQAEAPLEESPDLPKKSESETMGRYQQLTSTFHVLCKWRSLVQPN